MPESPTLSELYDWVRRCEEELAELKAAFPEVLAADRNRLIASIRCCRISLELRMRRPYGKAPGIRGFDVGTDPAS